MPPGVAAAVAAGGRVAELVEARPRRRRARRRAAGARGCRTPRAVADATPLWTSTNHRTATNAARTGNTTQGRKRHVNGAVRRRVTAGSVTSTFQRSASSGLALRRVRPRCRRAGPARRASRRAARRAPRRTPRPSRSDSAPASAACRAGRRCTRAARTAAGRAGPSGRRRGGRAPRRPCSPSRRRRPAARCPGAAEGAAAAAPSERLREARRSWSSVAAIRSPLSSALLLDVGVLVGGRVGRRRRQVLRRCRRPGPRPPGRPRPPSRCSPRRRRRSARRRWRWPRPRRRPGP